MAAPKVIGGLAVTLSEIELGQQGNVDDDGVHKLLVKFLLEIFFLNYDFD